MKVSKYKLQNKGAAIIAPPVSDKNSDLFTYIFADESGKSLQVCTDQNDQWIRQRDNGKTFNADASIIKKFSKSRK
jgi:hypothetical protein